MQHILSLQLVTLKQSPQLPETPLWLLSQNRPDDAERSLQWLRGWVPATAVATEFAEMRRYNERASGCAACQKANVVCGHPPAGCAERWLEMRRKRTVRPFALIMFCFVIAQFGGMQSIRPYMVQLFGVFRVPLDANWTTVIMGLMSVLANVVVMCAISFIGKRRLYFFSLAGTALSCFALSNFELVVVSVRLRW